MLRWAFLQAQLGDQANSTLFAVGRYRARSA